jgi:hypothetical protein
MLSISDATLRTLEVLARPLFARRVQAALAEKYLHFLPRFPEAAQAAIVGNMLGRASRWGIYGQRSLLAFCELMIAVAANFDEQSEIRAVLQGQDGARDQVVTALPDLVSEVGWAEAGRNATTLPFYIRPAMIEAVEAERTVAAIPLVLYDRPEAASASAAVEAASALAGKVGLADVPDALLVLAACRSFYREAFDESRLPWQAGVFGAGLPPHAVVNALRLRLALDFARFV